MSPSFVSHQTGKVIHVFHTLFRFMRISRHAELHTLFRRADFCVEVMDSCCAAPVFLSLMFLGPRFARSPGWQESSTSARPSLIWMIRPAYQRICFPPSLPERRTQIDTVLPTTATSPVGKVIDSILLLWSFCCIASLTFHTKIRRAKNSPRPAETRANPDGSLPSVGQRTGLDERIHRWAADAQHFGGVCFRDMDRPGVTFSIEPHGGGCDGEGFRGHVLTFIFRGWKLRLIAILVVRLGDIRAGPRATGSLFDRLTPAGVA